MLKKDYPRNPFLIRWIAKSIDGDLTRNGYFAAVVGAGIFPPSEVLFQGNGCYPFYLLLPRFVADFQRCYAEFLASRMYPV